VTGRGTLHYLVKPVTREVLLATLEDLGEGVKNVLLDDEREVLQLFSRMLSSTQHSYHVLRAKNGQQALSLLRQRRPDVMLLDLIMPGMDGLSAAGKEPGPICARTPCGRHLRQGPNWRAHRERHADRDPMRWAIGA